MTHRIHQINKKLMKSSNDFEKAVKSILIEECPLAPPRYQQQKNKSASYNQFTQVENPENQHKNNNHFKQTLKNQISMQMPNYQLDSNYEKTHKKFYTPQKSGNWAHIPAKTKFAVEGHLYSQNRDQSQHTQMLLNSSILENKQNKSMTAVKISEIDHTKVLKHIKSHKRLTSSSQPEQIFDYFYNFVPFIRKPLIKKFKNCLFFGDSANKHSSSRSKFSQLLKYQGFLYFYNNKLYYGDLENQHKNGAGVEINLNSSTVYKGIFQQGHKIGKFRVYKEDEKYQGYLNKGKYHGNGKLQTSISVYTGSFYNGERHGKGQQYFFKSGLKLVGDFHQNKFSNQNRNNSGLNSQKVISGRQSKLRKHKVNLPKIGNLLNYSYRGTSQSQEIQQKINLRHLLDNDTHFDMYKDQQDEDGPLPSPFRRFGIHSLTQQFRK